MNASVPNPGNQTALLLLDMQNFVLDNFIPESARTRIVEASAALLAEARAAGNLVIHVNVGFSPGYPEVSDRNKVFAWLRDSGLVEPGSESVRIPDVLAPRQDEPFVIKHRVGAFSGTGLHQLLMDHGIGKLVLAGATTSGAVLTTVRQAFDLDYDITVVQEACADSDEAVHEFIFDGLLPMHASVS